MTDTHTKGCVCTSCLDHREKLATYRPPAMTPMKWATCTKCLEPIGLIGYASNEHLVIYCMLCAKGMQG